MQKWIPTLTLVLGGIVDRVTPAINDSLLNWSGRHKAAAALIALAVGWILHALPSPLQPSSNSSGTNFGSALKVIVLLGALSVASQPVRAQMYSAEFGTGFYADTKPHFTGHASLLIDVDGTGRNFSFTTVEMRGLANGQPVYSTRTGFARLIQAQGKLSFFALANAGVAASPSATSGAFAGGGAAAYQFSKRAALIVTGQALDAPTASGWQPVVQLGIWYRP